MADLKRKDFSATLRDGRPQCQERVVRYIGGWPSFGQCSRAAVDGTDYCKQHQPEAVAAREAESREREEAAFRHRMKQVNGPYYHSVLRQIADGHNDPRALAIEAVGKPEPTTTGDPIMQGDSTSTGDGGQ